MATKKNDKTKVALAAKRKKDAAAKATAKKEADNLKKKNAAAKKKADDQKKAAEKLPVYAKLINTRLEKADTLDDKSADHRLAAAIELDHAKQVCKTVGVKFQAWCEDNVDQSYDTVRKLAAIGGSDNPKLALEDMRGKNKEANKKLRDKKKADKKKVNPNTVNRDGVEPADLVEQGFDALEDDKVEEIIREQAEELGLSVVSRDATTLEELKELFDELSDKDKSEFYSWIKSEMGEEDDVPAEEEEEEAKPRSRRRRTRKAA